MFKITWANFEVGGGFRWHIFSFVMHEAICKFCVLLYFRSQAEQKTFSCYEVSGQDRKKTICLASSCARAKRAPLCFVKSSYQSTFCFLFFFVTFSKESKQKANTSRIQWYGLSIASTFCTKSERFASYSWIEKVPTWIRMTFKSNFSVTVTDLQTYSYVSRIFDTFHFSTCLFNSPFLWFHGFQTL